MKSEIGKYIPWAVGLCFGMLFIFLMSIRLGGWPAGHRESAPPGGGAAEHESWMEIYRNDRKIGYSHRKLTGKDNGFKLHEDTRLRLNVMGITQDMRAETAADLRKDLSLSSFAFALTSGPFEFSVHGQIRGNELQVFIEDRKMEFPLTAPIFLLSSASDPSLIKSLTPGKPRIFDVFDPSTLGKQKVRITREARETVEISGRPVDADRFSMEAMGITQTAWITDAGEIVQETGPMGIRMTKSTRQKSLGGFDDSKSADLTQAFSIASDVLLDDPETLTRLKLSIRGAGDKFFLNGGRQTLTGSVLTIVRENALAPAVQPGASGQSYLDPSPGIRSDHPKIRQKTAEIVSSGDPPLEKVRKILAWMDKNIKKRPVLSVPDALNTLENGMGDCNEHAVLFAAMARSIGIPTRVEAGLVYLNGRFYYHAWNVVDLGGWITVDSLMGQMPADVTHIRLIRGDLLEQLDLIHAVDQIQLKILEFSK